MTMNFSITLNFTFVSFEFFYLKGNTINNQFMQSEVITIFVICRKKRNNNLS